jgi:hypothetical protein
MGVISICPFGLLLLIEFVGLILVESLWPLFLCWLKLKVR